MLEIKQLSKSFGGKKILEEVNITIPDGEIVTIVGPSGGGKTTLLRCICGLETMDEGTLLLDGQPLNSEGSKNGSRQIGIVFQDFNLFPHKSVLENLMLAPMKSLGLTKEVAKERSLNMLAQLEISEQAQHYPFELSGGQKQRVAIARALVMQPKVLCYDEPTSALDPALRDNVAKLLLGVKESGITQIIVTHDHDFAHKIADQFIEVNKL